MYGWVLRQNKGENWLISPILLKAAEVALKSMKHLKQGRSLAKIAFTEQANFLSATYAWEWITEGVQEYHHWGEKRH